MNKSLTNSPKPLKTDANSEPSPMARTDKPPEATSTKAHEEWLAGAVANMTRMHRDEAYRLEIAKKLS